MGSRRKPARVLIIEDNREMVALVTRVLSENKLAVGSVPNGETGITAAVADPPDLIILDVGLPGISGFDVVQELRDRGLAAPVLMLTARAAVEDRVTGLDAGADDYLTKPFEPEELLARVRALFRGIALRSRGDRLVVGNLVLHAATREVMRGRKRVPLTQREFDVLHYLMRNAGRTVSRSEIAEGVWRQPRSSEEASNIVDVYVAYLRRKLDDGGLPILQTVRGPGGGYRLDRAKPRRKRKARE